MRTSTHQQSRPTTPAEDVGLGPKKTFLVLFTVIGCIAILFPKIFYPMIMGPSAKELRGPLNLQKQERPPHPRELVHPGMQERGRAIPPHPSVPILERSGRPIGYQGNIERRPGGPMAPGLPGPNQRAAAFQAQQPKSTGQSIIMPIYTFGIVAFFVFTVVKMLMKKTSNNDIKPLEPDPKFAERVFKHKTQKEEEDAKKKLGWKDHNTIYTAIQGIIEATNDQLSEIERECAERNKDEHDGHKKADMTEVDESKLEDIEKELNLNERKLNADVGDKKEDVSKANDSSKNVEKSEHDLEIEKRLSHLREAMHIRAVENIDNSELKSIYLEGEFPDDPKILVSATETESKTEKMSHYPSMKDIADDEAVILSGKMTISLISLANNNHHIESEEKNGIVEDHTTETATTNNVA